MINEIFTKSILNKHKKRDSWFLDDYSVNPYQGCSFNCIYCYSRGSKYGINLANSLSVKINAPDLLEKQLSNRVKKNGYGIIAFASQEAYIPLEKEYGITRKLLEIILKYKFPVHIITKSTLVIRDLDLLKKINDSAILPENLTPKLKHGTIISFSFSTLDEKLAKVLEPCAPSPKERLNTLLNCKKNGFFVGINYIPILPFINDSEKHIEEMIKTASEYQVDFILVGGLTLFGKGPDDCKTLYYKMLEKNFPDLVSKYRSLYRIFFAPPKDYQIRLETISKNLCYKHHVKYGII